MGSGNAQAKGSGSREDRLKAALKANLRRRKDQARARADDPAEARGKPAGNEATENRPETKDAPARPGQEQDQE